MSDMADGQCLTSALGRPASLPSLQKQMVCRLFPSCSASTCFHSSYGRVRKILWTPFHIIWQYQKRSGDVSL